MGNVAVDDKKLPTSIRIHIKQSKTDPFRKGIDIFVGRTRTELCPVAVMLDFLRAKGMDAGALFTFEDG